MFLKILSKPKKKKKQENKKRKASNTECFLKKKMKRSINMVENDINIF